MGMKFHKLKVSRVIRDTNEAVALSFEIPESLKDQFEYKHGQFLTLKFEVGGKSERRAYSICSSPVVDEEITVAVKKIANGNVSKHITENLQEGDEVEVMEPMGRFTIDLDPENKKHYYHVGGGSGITPLMSIIKTTLAVEPKSKVSLLYANKDQFSIMFAKEFENLEIQYGERFRIQYIYSRPTSKWKGLKGRITKDIVNNFINDSDSEKEFFMCGPDGMMATVTEALEENGVDEKNIHKESFGTSKPKKKQEEEVARKVKIKLYGEEHEIIVHPEETIVMASMREGQEPPYSCQLGTCSTCRAKVISGKVKMDENESLTDQEVAEGYILSCTARPLSDDVYVDFDV